MEQLVKNPVDILKLDKPGLVELYARTVEAQDELKAQGVAIKEVLSELLEGDGEVIGDYSVTRTKRVYFTKTTLDQARELGAIKEGKDTGALRRLYEKGVEVPGAAATEGLLIRTVVKKKE